MVISCKGTCGSSPPAPGLLQCGKGGDCTKAATWASLFPRSWLNDAAATDVAAPITGTAVSAALYGTVSARYCPTNMNLFAPEAAAALPHQCHRKCIASTCTGQDCFCGGVLGGYDTASSSALCLDKAACQALCDALSTCTSYDLHTSRPRCFLNTATCDVGSLKEDASYSHALKHGGSLEDMNDKAQAARRLAVDCVHSKTTAECSPPSLVGGANSSVARRLTRPIADGGYSDERILRFGPIKFSAAGKYKLCFCDAALQASLHGAGSAESVCGSADRFAVEVGTVHVSGLSCLLSETKLRRGECISMHGGTGLRCYKKGHGVVLPPIHDLTGLATPYA